MMKQQDITVQIYYDDELDSLVLMDGNLVINGKHQSNQTKEIGLEI